jgi:hypothetical protein
MSLMNWTETYSTSFTDHMHRYPFLHRRLKQGYGLGWKERYKPWITVRQVKTGEGRTSHIKGYKVNRIHHLLSLGESSYLYMAERWPWVTDIREQWPILDFDRTNELHFERGIPVPQRGGLPQPVTIDFMLTEDTADGPRCRAVAIKPADLAMRKKTKLYLDVQRTWCEENNIPFSVVSNTGEIQLSESLNEIRKWFEDGYEPDQTKAAAFAEFFLANHTEHTPLASIFRPVSKSMRLDDAETFSLFRYCAWSNRIKLDLHKPIALNEAAVLAP